MPDESCRTCGGDLVGHRLCSDCRRPTQKRCRICNLATNVQLHQYCMRGSAPRQKPLLVEVHAKRPRAARNSFHFSLLAIGVVGVLILGLAATYSEVPQVIPDEAQATANNEIKTLFPAPDAKSYDNCLAYGSGESVTVTCPTGDGTVYKGILNMPQGLQKGFDGSVFSIRGISITENPGGSVVLQYQSQKYLTSYFGN